MTRHKHSKAWIIRLTLAIAICMSIGLMYYITIVKQDFVIFTNPDGPDIEE